MNCKVLSIIKKNLYVHLCNGYYINGGMCKNESSLKDTSWFEFIHLESLTFEFLNIFL